MGYVGRSEEPGESRLWDDPPPERKPPTIVRSDGLWKNFEAMAAHAARIGGYSVREQRWFGGRHGQRYKLDMYVWQPGYEPVAVSLKWQRVKGSFDLKVPDEVTTLSQILPLDGARRGYVVLGGWGFSSKARQRWCSGTLDTPSVKVVDFDTFMAKAWKCDL